MSAAIATSSAIKITNLRRPFTEKALRSHLAEYGSYDFFWLSRIKDVCLLQYDSPASAARAVPELHGRAWPEHGTRALSNPMFCFVLTRIHMAILFSHAFIGLALNVEFIDPDEARAAANASTAAAAAPLSSNSAPAAAPSATSNDAPSLLIHAMRTGKRAVVSAGAAVPHAVESDIGQSSRIGDLFKSTAALPIIYYKENERSHAKRARLNDADNRA